MSVLRLGTLLPPRMGRAFGVMAAAVGLLVSFGAAPAMAVNVYPPGDSGCPHKAFVQYSYISGADPLNNDEEYLTSTEMNGIGCYWRESPTQGKVTFNWAAVGHLDDATMEIQLHDCTNNTWLRQPKDYPNGTPAGVTRGGFSRTWTLNPHHTYRLRVWGSGQYSRHASGLYGGVGYFYAYQGNAPLTHKPWKDWGGTGCA